MITFTTFDGIKISIGKWISGSELYAVLDQYDISNDDFREAVITGTLSPYDEKGTEIIHAPFSTNWTSSPPGCRYENLEIRDVFDFCYKGEDIEKFLNNLNSSPDSKIEVQKESTPTKQMNPEQKQAANFFTREGAIWHIGFDGHSSRLKHVDGLLYISYLLLAKPETSISCRELSYAVSAPKKIIPESAAIAEGLNVGSRKQSSSDSKASQAYWMQWQGLQDAIDNAEDSPEGEMIKKESTKKQEELMPYLKKRNFVDSNDRKAQANIKKRLDKAYEAISKANMKDMVKHLQNHIKTDDAYGLSYTGAIAWEITIK